ncbi:YebC/PmpR family DNA-binding transcriptional regulator [Synechococcus sp. PCC 7336]|uniref:YebC/PmpR family DNA-binding transcriptional regulator n=1 Tax=Synechococcus sp. PCC 7336 TaxID=195250 RepID=UPI000361B818|nr:YebC/PmpR family DNA-binding transcriptional regulator [Synechococcus sp. PCC 7336]
MSQSKWASIRLHKAKADASKGATYTKLSRAITVAARQGEADPESNFALRAAVQKARAAGLPNDNIERAIARGSGLLTDGEQLESIRYEGYGPGGVAILMEILTDNRNRTAADVRAAFKKIGGNLGETGCVSYLFEQKGHIRLQGQIDEDELLLAVAEAGGDDAIADESGADVICQFALLEQVSTQLGKAGYETASSALRWIASTDAEIDDPDTAWKVATLIEKLENLDDVQAVFTNFMPAESCAEALAAIA